MKDETPDDIRKRIQKAKYKINARGDVHRAALRLAAEIQPIDWQIANALPAEFEIQETMTAGVHRIVRRYASNLDKYFAAWKRNSGHGISVDQHGAGERFSRDYQLATKVLSIKIAALDAISGGGDALQEAVLEAHHEMQRAMRAMQAGLGGHFGAQVVERVCGWDETTADCEKFYNWPTGHAIVRLREGLDDLLGLYLYGKEGQDDGDQACD